jgi:lipoprotein NlpI
LRRAIWNALLKEARDPDAAKEHDRLCETHFFLAEYELLAGVEKAAEADFQEAIDTRPTVVEYSAAAAELKRLTRQSPSRAA